MLSPSQHLMYFRKSSRFRYEIEFFSFYKIKVLMKDVKETAGWQQGRAPGLGTGSVDTPFLLKGDL